MQYLLRGRFGPERSGKAPQRKFRSGVRYEIPIITRVDWTVELRQVAECAKNREGGGRSGFLSFTRKGDGLFNARNRPGKLQYGSSLLSFDLPHFFGVKFYNPKGGSFFQNAATPRRKILRRFARMHGLTLGHTLARWERGERKPTGAFFTKIIPGIDPGIENDFACSP